MKFLKIALVLTLITNIIMSCQTQNQSSNITAVTYLFTAGRGGSLSIKATKETLFIEPLGRFTEEISHSKKNISAEDWKNIIKDLNIKTLENTKSGERRGVFDGSDEIFIITTTEKEIEIVNASDDIKNYKQLEQLKNKLKQLADQYKSRND